jgi:hypothetical protein
MDRVCPVASFLNLDRAASTRGFVVRLQDNSTIKVALGGSEISMIAGQGSL